MVVAQKQSIDANDKLLKPEVVAAHPLWTFFSPRFSASMSGHPWTGEVPASRCAGSLVCHIQLLFTLERIAWECLSINACLMINLCDWPACWLYSAAPPASSMTFIICMHACTHFFNIVVYCGCGISCGLYRHTWPCHAFRENRAGCSSSCVWGSSCQSFDWEAQDHWLSPGREVGRLPLYQGSSPTYGAPDSMGKWRCGQCHYIGSFGAELSSHGHGGRFSLLPDQCGQTPGHQFLESSGLNPTPMEFVNFLGRVKNSCMHVYNCSCHVFNNQRFLEGVETSIYAQHAREPCCHTPWFMGSEEFFFPCSSSSRCWADGFWRQPVPKSCSINHSWVSHQASHDLYHLQGTFWI